MGSIGIGSRFVWAEEALDPPLAATELGLPDYLHFHQGFTASGGGPLDHESSFTLGSSATFSFSRPQSSTAERWKRQSYSLRPCLRSEGDERAGVCGSVAGTTPDAQRRADEGKGWVWQDPESVDRSDTKNANMFCSDYSSRSRFGGRTSSL